MAASCEIIGDSAERYSGFLQKKAPSGLMRGWKNRWFTITEEQLDVELKYYTTETKEECKGTVNLSEVLELRAGINETGESYDTRLRFDIVMRGRSYELLAPTLTLKSEWLKVLSRVTEIEPTGGDGAEVGYVLEGYLLKQSGGKSTSKHWNTRYFRLRNDDDATTLQYFKDASKAVALGTIMLDEVTEVRTVAHETTVGGPSVDARFELKTHARVYVIAEAAGTPQMGGEGGKGKWVAALRDACNLPHEDRGPCGGRLECFSLEAHSSGLGLVLATAGSEAAAAADVDDAGEEVVESKGAVVVSVKEGSVAACRGVRAGDRLHRINGLDLPLALGHKVLYCHKPTLISLEDIGTAQAAFCPCNWLTFSYPSVAILTCAPARNRAPESGIAADPARRRARHPGAVNSNSN